MNRDLTHGILLIIAGGILQGGFAVFMKFIRGWSWENTWFIYSVSGLFVLPALLTTLTVPHLQLVYQLVPATLLFSTALFGFGWGIANVLCGLAFPRAGIALTVAIVVGLSASLGSVVPLLFLSPGKLRHLSGQCVVAGVCIAVLGIALLGRASHRREERLGEPTRGSVRTGIILCLAAGILAPMLNFSFAFGIPITDSAVRQGASAENAVNAVWLLALGGGFVANAGYCIFLFLRNGSLAKFFNRNSGSALGLATLMGVLWTVGLFSYGWGANALGGMKSIVGWPVFQCIAILSSTVVGIASGEWRGASAKFVRSSCFALVLLVAAIVLISLGNQLS